MINRLIRFSIENKLIIGLLTLALIVVGIWSITRVPLDAVPDVTNNQVQIITQAPNLGTEDIEQFVTYPVEVAMANLPGVVEIRSVSRFGLSLVTIVFEDDMGTYLPRQLVAEKLSSVKEEIPAGFGVPEMGPISTGLGEIYQYTLEVDSSYIGQYSAMDLRSIQDWIIRRQMAMVPGVVEVNAFGGMVKQYEVAISPDELKAIGLSITDVFQALELNNQNTGGAYIEKDRYANFIRGEGLVRSIEDIEQIVVSNQNGVPIMVKDVAEVRFGSATRYGAFTADGKGETVGGMILMLKDANSNDVINAVKERVTEIEKSLPEGVSIQPFLDRSELIANTTGTVKNNLMEGALIVIFVLVFLLGNWRGGLIVASTIPLSLLFAFILMHAFGVWANLMSLGAIDFGIIVDGAVIIVEATVFLLHDKLLKGGSLTKELREEATFTASSSMMNSAFFGQLIILIVFIPLLALEGVEGKMFKPMALTFMFAMIGVMVLCLTYVPMMTAWLIRMKPKEKASWGDRFILWLENIYEPVLNRALRASKWVLGGSVGLLAIAVFLFTRMGGEFVPQLDEGDIAFHIILLPGTSLTEGIETSTKAEQILLENFPEVEKVMSRFGVAEVPTDPMPMDVADCFIILKPQDEWTTTDNKEELIEMMKAKLNVLPGLNFEFTQPIEMRFNELLTGVREDVAVKLFGEDLNVLAEKAEEMGRIISTVEGVGDMRVEATSGLPQMTVTYQRQKLAQYGLNVNDLNTHVEAAFAGIKAGVIFEGEKRFDMVVRLDKRHRESINDLRNLSVNLENGAQIPLSQVAEISYQPGPMQISRDNTNRRTYVGVMVRGRDVQSVVNDISDKLDAELELPPGYYIRYGGAFENLERASKRLKIVVPVALGLIFLLVFFALRSVKQTTMIYMAIPLAAIGGVFSLWLRDMPFSISAGVGFIVLFGVAVLNGLVLISGWNELKEEGITDLNERIRLGTKRRIRPILLTALTDVLGFMPMAISTTAGAEVQQPLATVVIGGMISATLLTLFVLPILYRWVESREGAAPKTGVASVALVVPFLLLSGGLQAQEGPSKSINTLEQAIEMGLQNNGNVLVGRTEIQVQEQGRRAAFNPAKTEVGLQYGQYNSFENDFIFQIDQRIQFPTVYTSQRKLANERVQASQLHLAATENELKRDIRQAWYQLAFLNEKEKLLLYQDTIYGRFLHAASVRYETEEGTFLEKASAETRLMEVQNELVMLQGDKTIQERRLKTLLNVKEDVRFEPLGLEERSMPTDPNALGGSKNPLVGLSQQQVEIARAEKSLQTSKMLPDLSVGYFNQSMIGTPNSDGSIATGSDRFSGFQAGIALPLFFGADASNIKSAKLKQEMATVQAEYYRTLVTGETDQHFQEVLKYKNSLDYYRTKAAPQGELIIRTAQLSFENGAIDYIEYFQNLKQGLELKLNYINALNEYNQRVIALEYLIGQ